VTVARDPDDTIRVFWDNSCVSSGATKIVYGLLDAVSQYDVSGAVCGIPATADNTPWVDPPSEDLWFVVVKENDQLVEGSWGEGSAGERNGPAPSLYCSGFFKNTSGICP
jgi:hypothetical protein